MTIGNDNHIEGGGGSKFHNFFMRFFHITRGERERARNFSE